MRIAIIIAALVVAGCTNRGDPSICRPILDPPTPADEAASIRLQTDEDWQRKRAEACVHREAYRPANAPDAIQDVAWAVMEACDAPVTKAVSLVHKRAFDDAADSPLNDRVRIAREYEDEARRSYQRFARLKIVEGRAGKCRAG